MYRTITFSAPFPVVQGLPGVSYASLDLPPPGERKRWRLSPSPPQDGWAEAYLHRPDCAQAQSTGGMVSDEEALAALAGAGMITVPCSVCRPDTVLKHGLDLRGNDLSQLRGLSSLKKVVIDRAQTFQLAEALAAELDVTYGENLPE